MSGDHKADNGKALLGLVPLQSLYGLARVLDYGNQKHRGKHNWLHAASDGAEGLERYRHALTRHLADMWADPAALDQDSGLPHIDHVLANAVILRTLMQEQGRLEQDPSQ